jgi:pimeloyl-ACP methyl ester carboxylesterase
MIMKNKYLFLPGLLFALIFTNFGCTSEPVTVATSADGVEINFSNQGKSEPAILLVHGWTNNNTIWDLQVPVLSEKYQVIAIDLVGHGKSGNNRTEWTMPAFGKDIAAVVHAAKLKNVILVGFSMGGPAILEAAKVLPDQVSGLILVDVINNPEEQYPPPVVHWIDSTYMDLIENPTTEKAIELGFFVSNPDESMEKVKTMHDRDRTGWRECLLEFFKWSNEDCIGALKALEVPLIAINTDNIPTAVDVFKKYVPSFEAKLLSGTGHVMMWDVTEEFNRVLEESIQEIISAE